MVQIEALRLADIRSAAHSEVNHTPLLYLPDCLVDLLQVVGDLLNVLHASVIRDDLVLDCRRPKANLEQVANQMFVHNDEFAGEDAPRVDVRGEGLKRFVVAEDLRGRCSRHRSEKK